jgi:hypothetical protein
MQQTEIEQLGNKQIDTASNLYSNFFFHWALLAGATMTLIVPLLTYISEHNNAIYGSLKLQILIGLLIITITLSSIRNFIAARGFYIVGNINIKLANQQQVVDIAKDKDVNKLKFLSKIQKLISFISIVSYIIALVLLASFIWQNLPIYN